jgi:hypothetical protein
LLAIVLHHLIELRELVDLLLLVDQRHFSLFFILFYHLELVFEVQNVIVLALQTFGFKVCLTFELVF